MAMLHVYSVASADLGQDSLGLKTVYGVNLDL